MNLDEITQDELVDGWYSVAAGAHVHNGKCYDENDSLGCVKIRLLLSSQPNLADRSIAWLLKDYSLSRILTTTNMLKEKLSATTDDGSSTDGRDLRIDREKLRSYRADYARLLWRFYSLIDDAFQHIDLDHTGYIVPRELNWMMTALGESLTWDELAEMIAECKVWGQKSKKKLRRMEAEVRNDHSFQKLSVNGTANERTLQRQREVGRRLLKKWSLEGALSGTKLSLNSSLTNLCCPSTLCIGALCFL